MALRKHTFPWKIFILGTLVLCGVGVAVVNSVSVDVAEQAVSWDNYIVEPQSFTVTVIERGIIQPARIAPISSQIQSNQAKIVWLVAEGTQVRKGLLVARFDTKPFTDQMDKAEQDLADALATWKAAQKALEIQKEEEKGKISAAERKLELAEVEAADITDGSGLLQRKVIEQKLQQQQRQLELTELELDDLESLLAQGHISERERDKVKNEVLTDTEELEVRRAELANFDDYVRPQMLSKAKLLVSGAEADLQRVKRTAELLIQKCESDVEKNRRIVENKQQALEKAKQDVINCDIYAPASGVLLYAELPRENGRRKIQIGDSVWVGQTFLQIPDTSDLVAEVNVREVDVAQIDRDMDVELEVDAFPGKIFSGKVESIAALAHEDDAASGVRKFRTRIRMIGDTGRIHVGMSVTARVIVQRLEQVAAVPLRALSFVNGQSVVTRRNGSGATDTPISLGAQSSMWAEVVSGVELGDVIEIPAL